MTRYARGGDANRKKPNEATSWKEMNTQRNHNNSGPSKSRPLHGVHNRSQFKSTAGMSSNSDRRFDNPAFRRDQNWAGSSEKQRLQEEWKKEKRSNYRRERRQKKKEVTKVCFNCREPGHQMSECPEIAKDVEQGTGICFKCGSTEHSSFKCPVKLPAGKFPYAKCFICGETGHLSKQCPDNPRGLYPHGGCCKGCGSVEHLKRDCPEIQKQQGIGDVTLDRLDTAKNVEEVVIQVPVTEKKTKSKPLHKVVKF